MVTIAQGKFSNPRPNRHTDAEIAVQKAARKKVAPDPIEKAEADIAKFMDTAMQASAEPLSGDTQILPEVDLLSTSHPPVNNWEDATQVIPEDDLLLEYQEPAPIPRPAPKPVPQEDIYEEEETTFFQRNQKRILIGGISVILVLLLIIIGMVVSLKKKDVDDGKILNNVIAAGVNIGSMTPEEARIALYNATANSYDIKDMVVTLPDTVIHFTPADTGISLDVDALVEAAYNHGRIGTEAEIERAKAQALVGQYVMDILPHLHLNAEYIHESLLEYGANFNSSYLSSSYTFEGSKPGLTADTFDENAPCQTLVLKIGTPGRHLDVEDIYTKILLAYSNNTFEVDASDAPEEKPEAPDLEAIHEAYCSTPVDAYMDMQTFDVTGEIYGYTFDLAAAQDALSAAEYGSTVRIEMEYIYPEVRSADLITSLHADVLGSCQTPHTNNTNRNTNLKLACQAINGLILQPGEEFSFNEVVGERTTDRGYRGAPAYSNGDTVEETGGGVCQVSSTLYYAVLLADLEVTARQNHSYVSSYIDMGMDATVSWGGPDFKFRNSTSYPIRIEAEVADGYVKIQLLGTDKRDYYIKMEYDVAGYLDEEIEYKEFEYDNEEGYKDGDVIQKGSDGVVVDTYKHKYSKETNEKIGEEYVTRSSYRPHNKIIAKVEQPTTAPTEAPTTAPTEVPTEAPTEKPTEAPVAETEAPAASESPDVPDLNNPEP